MIDVSGRQLSLEQRKLALALIDEELERRRRRTLDICDWAEERFYISETERPIKLLLHQKGILRIAWTRRRLYFDNNRLVAGPVSASERYPFSLVLKSTVKKSGKSTLAAIPARYFAETQTRFGEIYCIGNDFEQAAGRSFKFVSNSIRLTPGCRQRSGAWVLPGEYVVNKTSVECLRTGTVIKPVSVDARGEAGGNPDLTVWTELWGFEYEDALRFWDEMTQSPTKRDSIRVVETYAGYDGESTLLQGLYNAGLAGHQLTNDEFARLSARDDRPGEGYEDFLHAFEECGGDPEAPVPIWVNLAAGMFMYWDSGVVARRMPWQRGPEGRKYYGEQEQQLPPKAFERFHLNLWVSSESAFVPMTAWDACHEDLPPLRTVAEGDKTPIVVGVDAATSGDCFAAVAVSRHPDPARHDTDIAIRALALWRPEDDGGRIDYLKAEEWLRAICANYKVIQIAYDPYQLVDMMQRLQRDGVAWCEQFSQAQERLKADRQFYDLIMNRRLAHNGDPRLREHIANANARLQKDEDSKMRIIKRSSERKVDLVVAASMAASRCLYLLI